VTHPFEHFMSPDINWLTPSSFIAAFADLTGEERMTTAVTINAHAGWPVLVLLKHGEPAQTKSFSTELVAAYSERTFYVHSGLSIVTVEECPNHVPQAEKLAFDEAQSAAPDPCPTGTLDAEAGGDAGES